MKQSLNELILILINIKIFSRCGHCQKLGPTWEQLAKASNEEHNNIRIAKVDCTTESTLCSEQDITGYPT